MRRVAAALIAALICPIALGNECLLLRQNSSGVVGMDGAASTSLGDGRSLFAFGDTFLGTIHRRRRIDAVIDHSFAVVSDGRLGSCFAGSAFLRDHVLRPPSWDERDRFWPGYGVRVGSTVVLFFVHARVSDEHEAFGFEVHGAGVVRGDVDDLTFDLNDARYLAPAVLPAALMVRERTAYVYLCRPEASFACVLARTATGALANPSSYLYYVAHRGFGGALEDATVVLHASAEFSVTFNRSLDRYLVVDIAPFAREISVRVGDAPQGPFGPRRPLMRCHVRTDEFCYGAKVHPQFSRDDLGFIYVTYNTNLMQYDPRSYAARPRLYWPRFVRIALKDVKEVAD